MGSFSFPDVESTNVSILSYRKHSNAIEIKILFEACIKRIFVKIIYLKRKSEYLSKSQQTKSNNNKATQTDAITTYITDEMSRQQMSWGPNPPGNTTKFFNPSGGPLPGMTVEGVKEQPYSNGKQ